MKHGHAANYKHTKTYESWQNMIQRCTNPRYLRYSDYGGRGITVDPSWRAFEKFLSDIGERPEGHVLDRIDNNGNYCKENCRWATSTESGRNKRSVKLTLQHVREIKQLLAAGTRVVVCARQFNVSARHIRHIKDGRYWND